MPQNLSGYRFVGSVVVCDINNDGKKEILTFAIQQSSPYQIKLFAIDYTGNALSGFNGTQTYHIYSDNNWNQELSVGNLNDDPYPEVVTLASDGIKVWDHTGQLIEPISSQTTFTDIPVGSIPLLADVDGDSNADIVFASSRSNNIYAYKFDGKKALGFPIRLSAGYCSGIVISDVDNEGHNELMAGNANNVMMWQTNGVPSAICDPTLITSNSTWNASQSICGDLIVKSGTLTINSGSEITLGSSSMIIVMPGASLVIDGANVLNANIRALSGSTLTIVNNGKIVLRSNAEFYTETGTNLEIPYGSIDK
jgi:hypothetical protein